MQAKRKGGGSANGEFVDHFLDVINTALFIFIVIELYHITSLPLIASLFSLGYLAQAAVFYQQYKSGIIKFDKVGSFEAVLMLAIIIPVSGSSEVKSLLDKIYSHFGWSSGYF